MLYDSGFLDEGIMVFLGGRVAINCKTMSKSCKMLQKGAKLIQNVAKRLKKLQRRTKSCTKRYKTQDAGRGGLGMVTGEGGRGRLKSKIGVEISCGKKGECGYNYSVR